MKRKERNEKVSGKGKNRTEDERGRKGKKVGKCERN